VDSNVCAMFGESKVYVFDRKCIGSDICTCVCCLMCICVGCVCVCVWCVFLVVAPLSQSQEQEARSGESSDIRCCRGSYFFCDGPAGGRCVKRAHILVRGHTHHMII
jgi:hypothetical protein